MGLVGITEGIETSILHHLDTSLYLFIGKGVTLSELMLIFTDTIDEHGFVI